MNKRYILLTLLGGFAIGANAQMTEANAGQDSINIAFHQLVSEKVNSYSGVVLDSKAFENSPEIDAKKALYGKIRGLQVNQGNGSSSFNEASLQLYGKTPLVLVDGFVRSMSDLTTSEIENITVLTDAASCALYGVRGANGVILVNTKRGHNGKLKVTAKYQFGLNTQFRSPEFADSYLYANSVNQALLNDGLNARYNNRELDAFQTGKYPMEYPNVNWWDEVYQNPGNTHRLNLTFNGGNERFRYYTVVDYYHDRSMLTYNVSDSRYNSKTSDVRLNLRTNIDVNLTPSTYMRFNLLGKLQENNTPNITMANFYSNLYQIPSAAFPIKHLDGTYGGNLNFQANNPIAMLRDTGHNKDVSGKLYADLCLNQKLDAVTKGLAASLAISFDNHGAMYEKSSKSYTYREHSATIDERTGALIYTPTTWGTNSAVLNLTDQSFKSLYVETNFQGKLTYDRTFGKHQVNGAAIYDQYSYTANNQNSSQKRQSAILSAGYVYDNRYLLNAVASWSGSAYLPDGDKFRFYPAVSAAWILSNEAFMKKMDWIDYMRLHASYGVSGWDGSLSHELWRSSYVATGSYMFTDNESVSGMFESSLPVEHLTVEKSQRATLGLDLSLVGGRLGIGVEGFWEKRSDILISSANSVTGLIGISVGKANEGINKYRGASVSLDWNDKIKDFEYGVSANITYMTSEVVNENQAFEQYDYLYHKGNKVNQFYGLEAIGFFQDELDINSSPNQTFSAVRPGDVKYKDQNGDNKIDSKDMVRMCGTSTPEVWFGFNLHAGYKGFVISADFQGITGVTTNLLNSPLYKPLINNGNISKTFLEREIPWSPDNRENATVPRLTTQANANNYQNSSLWYRDASFLKLRNLMVGYTFPKSMIKFADMQVYVQGTNLFSLDNIKFADPEQLVASYPSIRSFWAGVKFNF